MSTHPTPDQQPHPTTRIALVGDRSPHIRAHGRIPDLLATLREQDHLDLDPYWIPTEDVAAHGLDGFDGIWLIPGSPYRSEAGAVEAARIARTGDVPFLGTCGGFQHAVLEYARNVAGLPRAGHAEQDPDAELLVIAPLSCSLVGHEGTVVLVPGSLAESVLGVERTIERFHCSYGPVPEHLDTLTAHGLRFTGHDEHGEVRIAELPTHPFFLITLFQPELAESGSRPHRVIQAFAAAAQEHARARSATPVAAATR